MRRHFGTLLFAGLVSMAAVPALAEDTKDLETVTAPSAVAVQRVSGPATGLRDEAAMVLVGTALIGLAAAVRRAA